MENFNENFVINEMLGIEKNACEIIDDAKAEANRIIDDAREKVAKLIESTKRDLLNQEAELKQRLQEEASERLNEIDIKRQAILSEIQKEVALRNDLALKRIKEFLFGNILGEL